MPSARRVEMKSGKRQAISGVAREVEINFRLASTNDGVKRRRARLRHAGKVAFEVLKSASSIAAILGHHALNRQLSSARSARSKPLGGTLNMCILPPVGANYLWWRAMLFHRGCAGRVLPLLLCMYGH